MAYIHLTPLRAESVKDLKELRKYRWCGHGEVMGEGSRGIVAMEEILGYFGTDPRRARKKYESNIIERVGRYGSGELAEDGLPRGLVGKRGLEEEKRGEVFDERVLGRGDFVESILQEAGGKPQVKA